MECFGGPLDGFMAPVPRGWHEREIAIPVFLRPAFSKVDAGDDGASCLHAVAFYRRRGNRLVFQYSENRQM